MQGSKGHDLIRARMHVDYAMLKLCHSRAQQHISTMKTAADKNFNISETLGVAMYTYDDQEGHRADLEDRGRRRAHRGSLADG